MMLFNALTKTEKLAIEEYITKYGTTEGGIKPSAPLNYILRYWNDEKETIYKMFGEKLILTKEVEFNKPEQELYTDMRNLCSKYSPNNEGYDFIKEVHDFIFGSNAYKYFNGSVRQEIYDLTCINFLINNVFEGKTFSLTGKNGKTITIQHGCKVMKALHKIAVALEFDMKNFERFRLGHSRVLNQKTVKGTLCLSIHPLDYMTMSDNESGWTSCMSWDGGGEYRQGTVEMMNSEAVIVAYLKSKDDMVLTYNPRYEWNNKKWRQLFIVNENVLLGVKAYPYENMKLTKEVLNWLKELAEPYFNTKYTTNPVDIENHNHNFFKDIENEVYFSFWTERMYNDLNCSGSHLCLISTNMGGTKYDFCYSGATECMVCGCTEYKHIESERLACDDCNHTIHCAECGEEIPLDEIYWSGDYALCEDCYRDLTRVCPIGQEEVLPPEYDDSTELIKLYIKGRDTGYYGYICGNCAYDEESMIERLTNILGIKPQYQTNTDRFYSNEPDHFWRVDITEKLLEDEELLTNCFHLWGYHLERYKEELKKYFLVDFF